MLVHLAAGKSTEEILDEFPLLEAEDLPECLRYAAWLASSRAVEFPPAA